MVFLDCSNKVLTQADFGTFVDLYKSIESIAEEIFDYMPEILFTSWFIPYYSSFSIEDGNLCIEIGDEKSSDRSYFSIPISRVATNTWKEYIDECEKHEINKQEEYKTKFQALREEKEKQELVRLKAKYEKNT